MEKTLSELFSRRADVEKYLKESALFKRHVDKVLFDADVAEYAAIRGWGFKRALSFALQSGSYWRGTYLPSGMDCIQSSIRAPRMSS